MNKIFGFCALFGTLALAACQPKSAQPADAQFDTLTFTATDSLGQCTTATIDFDVERADSAIVHLGADTYRLAAYPTASGFGYKNDEAELRGKGNMATLTLQNGTTYELIEELEKDGLRFRLSVNQPKQQLTIVPMGLKEKADTLTCSIKGQVIDFISIDDLDQNNDPELYIALQSDDVNGKAQLVAYASNQGISMTDIVLPEVDRKKHPDYQGHDVLSIEQSRLLRTYPAYRMEKGQPTPTDETKVIRYALSKGEASWTFVEE